MPKKGINYWSFSPGTPLKRAIELAKDAGFEGIEFCMDETGELSTGCTDKEIQSVLRMLKDNGLVCSSVCSWLLWLYPFTSDSAVKREKGMDIAKKMLDTAAGLEAGTILCVPGYVGCDFIKDAETIPYDTALERGMESICKLAAHAEKTGVDVGLENVGNKMLLSPLEMRDYIDRIASPRVGVYFDVANAIYNWGYPEHWIRILGSRVKCVHFKDYRRDPGGFRGFVELLSGDVNFPEVMKALCETGYEGYCNAEIMPTYTHHNDAVIYNTSCSMDFIFGRK